jgi:hypothetical protein
MVFIHGLPSILKVRFSGVNYRACLCCTCLSLEKTSGKDERLATWEGTIGMLDTAGAGEISGPRE